MATKEIYLPLTKFASTLKPEQEDTHIYGIGGSKISVIMGHNKYKSRYQLWHEMKKGSSDFKGNELTHWGSKTEPLIVQEYAERTGEEVLSLDEVKSLLDERIRVNIDGFTQDDDFFTLLEAKNVEPRVFADDWDGGQTVPQHYYDQGQFSAHIICRFQPFLVGTIRIRFVVLSSKSWHCIEVDYDHSYGEEMYDAATEFLHDLDNNIEPAITGEKSLNEHLKSTFNAVPEDGLKSDAPLTDTDDMILQDIISCKLRIKDEEESLAKLENNFKQEYSGYNGGESATHRFTFKFRKGQNRFDKKLFESDYPEMAAEYMKQGSPFRVFTVKEKKK